MRCGSLFSGIGGIEKGLAFLNVDTVWQSEIDPSASQVLNAHWPSTPNLGDITRINWRDVEPVDLIVGGFPCQDISFAGKGAGIAEGTRSGLWSHYAEALRVLRPQFAFIENVSALAFRGLDTVLADLAEIGFNAEWTCLRASDIGAPHRRERLFLLASNIDSIGRQGSKPERGESPIDSFASDHTQTFANTDSKQLWIEQKLKHGCGGEAKCAGHNQIASNGTSPDGRGSKYPIVETSDRSTTESRKCFGTVDWGEYTPAIQRWEQISGPSPEPSGSDGKVNADFLDWFMGFPIGWTDVGISQANRIRCAGNSVLPQVARLAWNVLQKQKRGG